MSRNQDIDQLGYGDIMPMVGELADELFQHPDEEVSAQLEELLDWVDIFHREGLQRTVDLIKAWRGEVFLESIEKDEIVGPFLATYDLNESMTVGDFQPPELEQPEQSPESNGDGDLS